MSITCLFAAAKLGQLSNTFQITCFSNFMSFAGNPRRARFKMGNITKKITHRTNRSRVSSWHAPAGLVSASSEFKVQSTNAPSPSVRPEPGVSLNNHPSPGARTNAGRGRYPQLVRESPLPLLERGPLFCSSTTGRWVAWWGSWSHGPAPCPTP